MEKNFIKFLKIVNNTSNLMLFKSIRTLMGVDDSGTVDAIDLDWPWRWPV